MLDALKLIRKSEKQLICMARAILKRAKVLVMDEVISRMFRIGFCDLSYFSGDCKVTIASRSVMIVASAHMRTVLTMQRMSLLEKQFASKYLRL